MDKMPSVERPAEFSAGRSFALYLWILNYPSLFRQPYIGKITKVAEVHNVTCIFVDIARYIRAGLEPVFAHYCNIAETNIRDGQGSIKDYAQYFRNTEIDQQTARERGLLSRTKGKAGYIIGKSAVDDVYARFLGGKLSEAKAAAIANAAPITK